MLKRSFAVVGLAACVTTTGTSGMAAAPQTKPAPPNLVVTSKKPVVLTASMRPSTALSADGPLNFSNAVAVTANQEAAGRGVLVVVNKWTHGASSLTRASTTAVRTFLSPPGPGPRPLSGL